MHSNYRFRERNVKLMRTIYACDQQSFQFFDNHLQTTIYILSMLEWSQYCLSELLTKGNWRVQLMYSKDCSDSFTLLWICFWISFWFTFRYQCTLLWIRVTSFVWSLLTKPTRFFWLNISIGLIVTAGAAQRAIMSYCGNIWYFDTEKARLVIENFTKV